MRLAKTRLWPLILVGGFLTPVLAASGLASDPAPDPLKTLSIRIKNRDVQEVADLLETLRGARGTITADTSKRTVRIVDRPFEVDRMARIVREVDEPRTRGQKIWTYPGMGAFLASGAGMSRGDVDRTETKYRPGRSLAGGGRLVARLLGGFQVVEAVQLLLRRFPGRAPGRGVAGEVVLNALERFLVDRGSLVLRARNVGQACLLRVRVADAVAALFLAAERRLVMVDVGRRARGGADHQRQREQAKVKAGHVSSSFVAMWNFGSNVIVI